MCGIVGLFLKDKSLEPELGRLTAAMLATLSDRGPDSAGFAVYGGGRSDTAKFTLRGKSPASVAAAVDRIRDAFAASSATHHDTHVVVTVPADDADRLVAWLGNEAPEIDVVGRGHRM